MTDTIETFVARLRQEGVAAGQTAAARLTAEAESKAAAILAQAQTQAQEILAAAEAQAREITTRAQGELALASRDTVARLRERLGRIIQGVLSRLVGSALADPELLAEAVVETVKVWAAAERDGKPLTVILPAGLQEKVEAALMAQLGVRIGQGVLKEVTVSGSSSQAGFSFSSGTGTVLVDQASVVEHLAELTTPALAEAIRAATRTDT